MKHFKLSLRRRIFIFMILLVLGASILIAGVTIYQYKEESEDYHRDRLERKEEAIRENINFVLRSTTYEITPENIALIFKERNKIYEMSQVHNLPLNIYSLEGNLLLKSKESFFKDSTDIQIKAEILEDLSTSVDKRFILKSERNGEKFQSSFTYITDNKFRPLAILNLPYLEEDDFLNKELAEFLLRLGEVYLLMLVVAIALSYFLSRYITRSLKTISDKITETRLNKRNAKIEINDASEEIYTLVNAYNSMIDELEGSAAKLATSEREAAWREMAKQVAHEIKNPLTPMRLSVQSFQRKFDPQDPEINHKVEEYSNTLIQQIDTMSSIASAFSNFAKMPAQQSETLNVSKIVKLALDIFNEDYIEFQTEDEEILAKFDRTQLIRVVTNLVKNAIQATEEQENPMIKVDVSQDNYHVCIAVQDNGVGIPEDNKPKVFEPKFTTKNSGMGLGLAMVKNIVETFKGTITFESHEHIGTTFRIKFPKH
ncbi:sensor histidine kinase [Croceibacter atlanticus]|uniref:sensor histidine kinase n=1 Tax=Croceibacter atlanticus TaxID=313588 RepID=UPI002E0FF12E|nr:ATP-binding protein [Croceibacter atlanticus]